MIGYRISKKQLEALIDAEAPGRATRPSWLERAEERTSGFRTRGFYEEKSSIWSEVKVVYMRLQGNCKCGYCERKLEATDLGKVEQDVEHFRPKGSVKAWRPPKALTDQGIVFAAAPRAGKGYYLLPYHPFNYSAACKPCNSALKKDFFPIGGAYDLQGDDPVKLKKEKPYLICPIGDFDDLPEDLIKFHGVSPQAVAAKGHDRDRALVTIQFFKLDDQAKRKNLLRERAVVIIALYPQLEKLAEGATGNARTQAQKVVDGFTGPTAPHTNCARSFSKLFESDRAEAKAVFDRVLTLINSIS
jgi:hypothetical protein